MNSHMFWSFGRSICSPHSHPNVCPQSHLRLDSCRNSSNISESVEARDWRQQSPIVRDLQQDELCGGNSMELLESVGMMGKSVGLSDRQPRIYFEVSLTVIGTEVSTISCSHLLYEIECWYE
jgi:hypothetical protein